jgi:hypothetical protein
VQAITGIANFYRQFGYEYALELEDKRFVPLALLSAAKDGEEEPFALRAATNTDLPLIAAFYERRRGSSIVSETITDQQWRYEIETWKEQPASGHAFQFFMIVDALGHPIGFVATDVVRWGKGLGIWLLEVAEGVNLQRTLPSLLRALHAYALTLEPGRPDTPQLRELNFVLGSSHPLYQVMSADLVQTREPPYAWYVRVPQLPAFLKQSAPALEHRLAVSPVAGYTGEITLDFYRGGLRLAFEQGRLTEAEDWRAPMYGEHASGGFPPLVFLQLLFGHRTDVWANEEVRPVLTTLFPTRPSFVFGW